jgi:hypothetical protein
LWITTSVWVGVLAVTVVARSLLAWRILRPVSSVEGGVPDGKSGEIGN